jgi:hypothetical protein
MAMKTARDFPYQTVTDRTNHGKAVEWCKEKFGPRWEAIGYREGTWCTFWQGRGVPGSYEWFFLNEQDYLMFTLKWL